MNSLREFGKDLIKYVPSFVVPAVVSFVSIFVFTKYIDPAEWGDYVLVQNGTELLVVVGVAWLSSAIVRYYDTGVQNDKLDTFIATIFFASIAVVVLIIAVVLVIYSISGAQFQNSALGKLSLTGVVLFAASALFMVLGSLMRAARRVPLYSALVSWQQLSKLLIGFFLVAVFGWGGVGILIGGAIGMGTGVLYFGPRVIKSPPRLKSFSWSLLRSLLLFGLPIVGGDLAYWVLRLADRYILRLFRSAYEVGIYALAFDLSNRSLMLLITLLATASWPLVVQTWERKPKTATAEFLTQLMQIYLLLCLPAVVGISLLAKPFVDTLASDQFLEGYVVIPLVTAGIFLYGFQRWFQLVLALYKRTYLIMASVVIGAFVNILLNFIFIPSFGYIAAAINNIVGYAVFTSMIIFLSRRYMKWQFPYITLFKSLIACLGMAAVLTGLMTIDLSSPITLVAGISIGTMVYVIGLFLLGELSVAKIRMLVKTRSF